MDPAIQSAIAAWLADPAIARPDCDEIRALLDSNNEPELADRFYKQLEFGTGGLRGIMGAGLNRMNAYTLGAAAQGLANHLRARGDAACKAGVAIAYDCRRNSAAFAVRIASVLAANGITAHLCDELRPTPLLSFAVRHLRCAAGAVITASHNPPQYNGLKIYGDDGAQVVPPEDAAIIESVRNVGPFSNIRSVPLEEARANGLVRSIGRDIDEAFLRHVDASWLNPSACRRHGPRLKIVFTALHGTGGTLAPQALRRRGFERVYEVAEQAIPDGAFPTVKSPNPEEPPALELAINLARRENADLVIATDPDADRVGIALRNPDADYQLLTGNQTAALLTNYLCEQRARSGHMPPRPVVLSTIVSSDLMKEIARAHGAEIVETLTGFKWIAEKIRQYESADPLAQPTMSFIFGAEESYGYLPAPFVRDKDAITTTAFIAEMAAAAADEGKSLLDILNALYARFGYFQEGAKNLTMPGKDGAEKIARLMSTLRKSPPAQFANQPVAQIADLLSGECRDARSGRLLSRCDLPPSDVLIYLLDDGTKVIARPSGTEPKIKFYILSRQPPGDLAQSRRTADALIAAISRDLDTIANHIA